LLAGYRQLLAAGTRLQWDAAAIDLSHDCAALQRLPAERRGRVTELLAGFWVAEHQVADQLRPFIAATDGDARRCFELQAGDERRHARFFDRVVRTVLGVDPPTAARELAGAAIIALFDHELPVMAAGLQEGTTGLGEAVALYHLVLEAIVLAAGEEALLREAASLPGVADGAARVQADERWHVGLGVQALLDSGFQTGPALDRLAARAAGAWGEQVAGHEATAHALATHRRRVALLRRHSGVTL
jgi:ribonucleotide reductase beta subunit family protein with ferritin-like domain